MLLGFALSGCTCLAPDPTNITLVATNTLDWELFVPDDGDQSGFSVLYEEGSSSEGDLRVIESSGCACELCANACSTDSCVCEPKKARVRRIPVGGKVERLFKGRELQSTRADCGIGDLGPQCLLDESPLLSGSYQVEFCFAARTSSAPPADGGERFDATLATDAVTCIRKTFNYPSETRVELSPERPAPCSAGSCPKGQLCQRGVCSSSCLPHEVPSLGAGWSTSASRVSNQGLLAKAGTSPARFTGRGTVGAVTYDASGLRLSLFREEGVGRATAQIAATWPPGFAAPTLEVGQQLDVLLIETDAELESTSALVLRNAEGRIVLALDSGLGGLQLQDADLAPMVVRGGQGAFACDASDLCGRRTYQLISIGGGGADARLEPGKSQRLVVDGAPYAVVAVASHADERGKKSDCDPAPGVTSFVLSRQAR